MKWICLTLVVRLVSFTTLMKGRYDSKAEMDLYFVMVRITTVSDDKTFAYVIYITPRQRSHIVHSSSLSADFNNPFVFTSVATVSEAIKCIVCVCVRLHGRHLCLILYDSSVYCQIKCDVKKYEVIKLNEIAQISVRNLLLHSLISVSLTVKLFCNCN